MKDWIREHKKEIIVGGVCSVIAGGAVFLIMNGKVSVLKAECLANRETIAKLANENADLVSRLEKQIARHALKDSYFKELMSDGLRHKSSLAAKHMVDRREFLKEMIA